MYISAAIPTAHEPNSFTISPRSAGISFIERGIAPVQGVACSDMNWHDYFTYDAKTGDLIWKERKASDFRKSRDCHGWNLKYAGKVAGSSVLCSKRRSNYTSVSVHKKIKMAHRIVWEMHYGQIPDSLFIDHINLNTFDNRLSNLRLANRAENLWNRPKERGSTSGLKGVCWDARAQKWKAQISVNKIKFNIGRFDTKGMAAVSYAKAAIRYHGKFARFT